MSDNTTIYHYTEAILPRSFTICGITLKPFSLGHLLLLERMNNPLIAMTEESFDMDVGLSHFFQALCICALTYEDGLKMINDEEFSKEVIEVIQKSIDHNMSIEPNWNIYGKNNIFKEYMQYFFEIPTYSVESRNNEGASTGLDWKIGIWQTFKRMGYSETEILNMNMRRLFYEWCQYAESEGTIKVVNARTMIPAEVKVENEVFNPIEVRPP
jgi:hypothetical protein